MPRFGTTSRTDHTPVPEEVDDESRRMSRTVFVRGMGLALAGFVAVPASTWNAVSAFAASATQRSRGMGTLLGNVRALGRKKALTYTDPASGDPAVIIRLGNGRVVSYDAVCTHAGCTVGYEPTTGMLLCPCHNSTFDPNRGAAVVTGPAPSPLSALAIRVDAHGNVYALDGKATGGTKGTKGTKLHPSKPPVRGSGDDGVGKTGRGKHSHRHGSDDGGGGGD